MRMKKSVVLSAASVKEIIIKGINQNELVIRSTK